MNTHAAISIHADTKTARIIQSCLALNYSGDLYTIQNNENAENIIIRCGMQEKTFSMPVRFGVLLDALFHYHNTQDTSPDVIVFQSGSLDVRQSVFQLQPGKQVRLTEKETEILLFLYKHKGKTVARDVLLRAVWHYADNAQTHTLETHIYRLRQKIEQDPARPAIVVTTHNGYRVVCPTVENPG